MGQKYFHTKIFLYIFHIKPLIFNTFSWSHSLSDLHEIFSIKPKNTIVSSFYNFHKILFILFLMTWFKHKVRFFSDKGNLSRLWLSCLVHRFSCSLTHGVGSDQFLSVNISVIRLLSVITTTPFGNYGTSETMFDQKRWKKTKNIGKILPILYFTEQ
jgi:hypothetical protein